jgi:hypothetical protein
VTSEERAHEQAVMLAEQTSEQLRVMFDLAGTTGAPDGWLVSAYRNAAIAMRGHLLEADYIVAMLDAMRAALRRRFYDAYDEAFTLGAEQAQRQLVLYGVPFAISLLRAGLVAGAVTSIMALVDAQIAKVRVLSLTRRARDAEVLGDGARAGLWTPAPIMTQNADWLVRMVAAAHEDTVTRSAQDRFEMQAVATIDERTTDCCLRVHAQIRPMRQDYILTGVPRYADRMASPPFHWWCRTAQALVVAGLGNDALTQRMRAAADKELLARARTGKRVEIHPSNALSGRGG